MKMYTLKYLPVDGEIGMGDYYLLFMHGLKSSKRRREETGEQFVIVPRWNLHHFTGRQGDKLALLTNPSDRTRVKLYLVSYDIKVGDLIWTDHERSQLVIPDGEALHFDDTSRVILLPNGEKAVNLSEPSSRVCGWANLSMVNMYHFKMLGEISPIPEGIKLDQQVTEDQVRFMVAVDASQPDSYMEFNERTFLEHPELPRKIELKLGI